MRGSNSKGIKKEKKKSKNLGVRKASAERGVSGSNLTDDNPAGAWKTNPSGANEDEEEGCSSGTAAGAWSTTMLSPTGPEVELGGQVSSSGSYTRQKQQHDSLTCY